MRWKVNKDIKSGDFKAVRVFSQFDNFKEMDKVVDSFLYFHKEELTKTARELVGYIRKFIYKNMSGIGVCTSKKETIADEFKCHPKTVSRAIKQLFDLGFLMEPFQTWNREKNAAGHLVLAINKMDIELEPWMGKEKCPSACPSENVPAMIGNKPCESKVQEQNNATETNILINNLSKDLKPQNNSKSAVKKSNEIEISSLKEDIPSWVDSDFANYMWDYRNLKNPEVIADYWKSAVTAYCHVNKVNKFNLTPEQHLEIVDHAKNAFAIAIGKKNKLNKNNDKGWFKQVGAFFYGVCKKSFSDVLESIQNEKSEEFEELTPMINANWDQFVNWRKNRELDTEAPF